ncbi:MAG TPA: tetratricopeptide repeat protein [Kiritimatiellae bacterium]|nr:tetratricopeptide repeat protein [Kiritimatiellia bacterium]
MASQKRKKSLTRNHRVEIEFLEAVRRRCPGKLDVLHALGDLYTRVGKYQEGLRVDEQLVSRCPSDPFVWYNLACSYALVGDRERAMGALKKAVDLGYDDFEWAQEDGDLDSLRKDPEFTSLLERMKLIQAKRESGHD